jgi:hypothetical protein
MPCHFLIDTVDSNFNENTKCDSGMDLKVLQKGWSGGLALRHYILLTLELTSIYIDNSHRHYIYHLGCTSTGSVSPEQTSQLLVLLPEQTSQLLVLLPEHSFTIF